MEMNSELVAAAVKENTIPGVTEFIESYHNKETGQQKAGPDKKLSAPPAPFYDELHFADYE